MENTILLGRGREIKQIPAKGWVRYQLKGPDRAKNTQPRLKPEHIRLRSQLMQRLICIDMRERHGKANCALYERTRWAENGERTEAERLSSLGGR